MNKNLIKTITFMALCLIPLRSGASDMPQVRGSDTMVNLVQKLAEVYMQKNPGKHIAISGGGSGHGLSGLRNRTTDVANSSREIRQREIIDMKNRGVNPVGTVVARDCMTIVVNKDNMVDSLTLGQLGAIFRGNITNWKDVGGADMSITLYGRQSNSGTYVVFRERVLKDDYSFDMNRMNGNSQIVEAVKNDVSGIGYVGLGYARKSPDLKVVKVAVKQGEEYIDPANRSDVEAGKYPLIRPVYQYTDGIPSGNIRNFMLFELGPEGQKIVDDMGFLPVSEEYAENNIETSGL
jgi:phosphate transport system substrate-binding protein